MKQGRFLRPQLIFKSGTEQTPKEFYDRDCDPVTGTMTSKHPVVGKAEMAEYRAYTIGIDGHIVGFEALVCADDVEAINGAKRLVDGHDIELWNGARFIIRLSRSTEQRRRQILRLPRASNGKVVDSQGFMLDPEDD